MNAKYKKSLKIVTLLITAIVIGTVSATTYNYMYINGTVTIGTQKLVWYAGTDAPGDIDITGGTVTMDLEVQPGIVQNFTECLFLKNEDSVGHNLNLTVTTALSTGDFNSAKAYIYENSTGTWVSVDTLVLTTLSDQYTGSTPLAADNYYRLTFEIGAKATATGIKSFALQLTY